jgi:hypothetical protein
MLSSPRPVIAFFGLPNELADHDVQNGERKPIKLTDEIDHFAAGRR